MFDNFAFTKPLDPKLHSKYIEQLSFLLLKHIFPDVSSKFVLRDAPDLQTIDKSVGIEITEAISPKQAQITGEYLKLRYGKSEENEKEKCRCLIKKNGGILPAIGIIYPPVSIDDEWSTISNVLKKKLELLPSYRTKGFKKMGLFILLNDTPVLFDLQFAFEQFTEIQKDSVDRYDFLLFGYHYAVIGYDFSNMSYKVYTFDQEAFDELSICARKIVEV